MFYVYILHSLNKQKFYVGQTNKIEDRLTRHNSSEVLSTKYGVPWELVYSIVVETRADAMLLERKIKNRGAKRYLEDIGFFY